MAVEYCLSCDSTCVYADIETANGRVGLKNLLSQMTEKRIAGEQLLLVQSEIVVRVTLRHYQRMQLSDRETIAYGVGKVVLSDYPITGNITE